MTLEERVRIRRDRSTKRWYRFLRLCGYVGGMFTGLLSLWFLLILLLS